MGVSASCPLAEYNDVEDGKEAVIVKSINFGDDNVKTPVRSVSFNGRDLESTVVKSLGPGKVKIEASISFKGKDLERMVSFKARLNETKMGNQSPNSDHQIETPFSNLNHSIHEAAIKLQKVYKSFRTRRKLADCAVLIEQTWWKLLDFAELKRSSISFFDLEKHETAISRWSRARTRAAKVGKGLSKNNKAQKLALRHWLEAIDPRHRYGHNLHLYYVKWLHSQSREPFFYWLDIGEGKEVNIEKCPRSKLQQQCIKYLGPMERQDYEVILEGGKFVYRKTGELLDTTMEEMEAKWIFVLSTSTNLYVGKKKKGKFQHSSFLSGGATSAAGRLVVENGVLKAVWPHSGHYRPTEENFRDFLSFLRENHVDLTDVKMSPVEDDEVTASSEKQNGRNDGGVDFSDDDAIQRMTGSDGEEAVDEESANEKSDSADKQSKYKRLNSLVSKLTYLEIPNRDKLIESLEREDQHSPPTTPDIPLQSPVADGLASDRSISSNQNNIYENEDEIIRAETIFKRILSRRGTKTYQLGKQLSCKWTTGAGPRISCVRDYPAELQVRALEHVSLSPRSIQPKFLRSEISI